MKKFQKGSAKVWIIIIVVFIVLIGGVYIWYQQYGYNCNIAGVTYYGHACDKYQSLFNNVPATNQYEQAQQEANNIQKSITSAPPAGFLMPANIPNGYTLLNDPMAFTDHSATWTYRSGNDSRNGPQLTYIEDNTSSYDQFVTNAPKLQYKLTKTFTYNGVTGSIYSNGQFTETNYALVYEHAGALITINSFNDQNITPDTLISLLKSMTTSK